VFFGRFPTQQNSELLSPNNELFPQIKEFAGLIREMSNSPPHSARFPNLHEPIIVNLAEVAKTP
jgi:hypothetical protein